jgi:CDP-glycerol glycerophosphotransferase
VPAPARLSPIGKAQAVTRLLLTRRDPRTILFNSFAGRFSDNPRAIYEEVVVRGADLTSVWVSTSDLPPDALRVGPRSRDFAEAAGRASIVVSNEAMPHFVKKPGVTYLQTWHGTMLKRIGHDNPRYHADAAGLRRARRDYRRWDLLLSQNPHSTRTMRRAFRYDGEILEYGYPRNDVLLSPQAGQIRQGVRARYGIADDVCLVLYAPTFRDESTDVPGPLPLDLGLLRNTLGDGVHVLARLHHRMLGALTEPPSDFWTNASDHPDIRDLYLASDVLVTDYSSVMFDYAVTGKPMLFFTYDIESYRDRLRGFYFDLTEQAPGPLMRTTAELADALGDLARVQSEFKQVYAGFRETYCPWDDGSASRRVVDRLLRHQ